MSEATIDYGIDLGTTNSAIAVVRDVRAEVIKNNDGDETTPSAVLLDGRGRVYVGRGAREQIEARPEDAAGEFKLLMGTAGAGRRFAAAGRVMTPEQLSAEVLKSLRSDVRSRLNEDLRAAVITVPAAFDLNACDATRRAAELAGLTVSPLLQEPTAAAHAYGFQSTESNARWLVYDFGGGTFDAAVIQLRDGEFGVVGHCGDNFLGGKLIDWKIVEELLVPAAVAQSPALAGLRRGDPRWYAAISQLKQAAETAKIRVSRTEFAPIELDLVVGKERRIRFEYELSRADVERLAEPFVARSINLCRTALAEHGFGPAQIEKVIMAGGQTLMPYLRERVSDPVEGLGIPLEFDQDPMTVVARGAAIFAAGQPLPAGPAVAVEPGGYTGRFEYPRVGPDPDPLLLGCVSGPSVADLSVELVNSDTLWRSGRLALPASGEFSVRLNAERGRRNTFLIELTDATGTRQRLTPDQIRYTVGAVETQPLLTHAIGIGTAANELQTLVERNAGLPVRRTVPLCTVDSVRSGEGGGLIRIPVLEGDHRRADRNRRIGRIEVTAAEVHRTVPAGSEVQLTIEIDASRLVRASVYVPILDTVFTRSIDLTTEAVPDVAELSAREEVERVRLADVRQRQQEIGSPVAELLLARIDDERLPEQVRGLVRAAADAEAAREADRRLLDLCIAIDAVEDELAWPALVRDAESALAAARDVINSDGSESDRADLPLYERAITDAIAARHADLLRQRVDELGGLVRQALDRTPALQIMIFDNLVRRRAEMRIPGQADRLIAEGTRAMDAGEQERLRTINLQLSTLLSEPPADPDPFSTVYRAR